MEKTEGKEMPVCVITRVSTMALRESLDGIEYISGKKEGLKLIQLRIIPYNEHKTLKACNSGLFCLFRLDIHND